MHKRQAPLRKSIGRALRKCLEDNPTPQLHSKKRAWNSEEGDEEHQRHQTPRKENGKVGKKTRGKAKSEINKGDSEVHTFGTTAKRLGCDTLLESRDDIYLHDLSKLLLRDHCVRDKMRQIFLHARNVRRVPGRDPW